MLFAAVKKRFKRCVGILKRHCYRTELIIVLVFSEKSLLLLGDSVMLKAIGKGDFKQSLRLVIVRLGARFRHCLDECGGYMRIAVKQHTVKIPYVILHNQKPLGFIDCQRQESSHISSMPLVASQPSSAFAFEGSEKQVAMSPGRRSQIL